MQYPCRHLAPAGAGTCRGRDDRNRDSMGQQTWWATKPKGGHGNPARPCAHAAGMSARFAAYGTVDLVIDATAVRPGASWEGSTG